MDIWCHDSDHSGHRGYFWDCKECEDKRMVTSRKAVLESDLGNLQAFGVSEKDLRTIERAINSRKKIEMEETKVGIRPVTTIYIEDKLFIKVEGY